MSTEATMTETATTTEGSLSETTTTTGTVPSTEGQPAATAPATEGQPQTETSGESTEGTETKSEVPEAYELKLPEGVEVAAPVTDKFTELAKKHSLTQDAAQELYGEIAPLIAQHQAETLASLQRDWVAQATADKEIGGDKLQENMSFAKSVYDKFGTPELGKVLTASGLANHPELLRWAYRVGKATSEDRLDGSTSTNSAGGKPDPAKVLFPNHA